MDNVTIRQTQRWGPAGHTLREILDPLTERLLPDFPGGASGCDLSRPLPHAVSGD